MRTRGCRRRSLGRCALTHTALLLLTAAPCLAAETSAPASAAPAPYGIVAFPDNTLHLDSGVASQARGDSPFFPSRATTLGRTVTSDQFDPPEVCGGCHADIYAQWKGSMHSNAWTDPVYRAALRHASKASGGKTDPFCMGCHTPIGVVTHEASPSGERMSPIADRGVQCDVCHNISQSRGIGNGAYVLTPKLRGRPLKFGPFNDAMSPYHDTAYSRLHTQSEFCGQCHDVTHPFTRVPLERTYSEWRDSAYAGEGIQCQDCHMKSVRGAATSFSKVRERIYTHYFVGGNALVPRLLADEAHAQRAEEMLKSAARVDIFAPAVAAPGSQQTIRVRVSNVGAGHKLPTGFPEGREMWLDFKVIDSSGHALYRLGAVTDGSTEPGTRSFKVVLGDRHSGVIGTNILDADRVLYDTRIEPRGYREVEYQVRLPAQSAGRVQIVADLNYWSFSQALLDELMGKAAPRTRIVRMTSGTATIHIAKLAGTSQSMNTRAP
jgi:hypothetical protein